MVDTSHENALFGLVAPGTQGLRRLAVHNCLAEPIVLHAAVQGESSDCFAVSDTPTPRASQCTMTLPPGSSNLYVALQAPANVTGEDMEIIATLMLKADESSQRIPLQCTVGHVRLQVNQCPREGKKKEN